MNFIMENAMNRETLVYKGIKLAVARSYIDGEIGLAQIADSKAKKAKKAKKLIIIHERNKLNALSFYYKGLNVSKEVLVMLRSKDNTDRNNTNIVHDNSFHHFNTFECLYHLDAGLPVMVNSKELELFEYELRDHGENLSNFRAFHIGGDVYKVVRKHMLAPENHEVKTH